MPLGTPIDFVIGKAPFVAYRFVGTNGQRYIDQFIYQRTGLLFATEARMNNVTTPVRSFPGYSIVFGSDMNVTEIFHGSRMIYRVSACTP